MPPSRRLTRVATPLVAALALVACNSDSPSPVVPPVVIPATLTVSGRGDVSTRYTADLWAQGSLAYTTTWLRRGAGQVVGNAVLVWDIADATPTLVDSAIITPNVSTIGDVQASDDGRLLVVPTELAPGSIVVFDLANPKTPVPIARFTDPSITNGVHTCTLARVNGTLYAFLAVNRSDKTPSSLLIVDLHDPANPQRVLSRVMGDPFIHDVFVRDGILFTALWDGGMALWDIGGGAKGGSVANPLEMGHLATVGGEDHNIWWYHDGQSGSRKYAFVGEEGPGVVGFSSSGDVHVVDISNPASMREVAFYHVAGAGAHNFAVDEGAGILYAAFYNAGVQAIDVRGDLSTCPATARASDGRCDMAAAGRRLSEGLLDRGIPVYIWGVQLLNGSLYASDMLNGLWKLQALSR